MNVDYNLNFTIKWRPFGFINEPCCGCNESPIINAFQLAIYLHGNYVRLKEPAYVCSACHDKLENDI